jgi:hypothetical protein
MPERAVSPEYPDPMKTRRLDDYGRLCLGGRPVPFCTALAGEPVGLELIEDATWNVFYGPILLAEVRVRGRRDLLVHAA